MSKLDETQALGAPPMARARAVAAMQQAAAAPKASGARQLWRRTGADLPWGDPRPSHQAEMEGYFWRVTHPASGRVVVALCGINRSPTGRWATVAVAVHPEDVVRSAAVDPASDSEQRLLVSAGSVLAADDRHLRVELDDVVLDLRMEPERWPHALPGGGVAGIIPLLGQYWHPHLLRAPVSGTVQVGDERWSLDGGEVYAEKNWGRGFPDRWWWGQAGAFDAQPMSVAFGGGVLTGGPIHTEVTGVVCGTEEGVFRFAPPLSHVRSELGPGTWSVRGRTLRSEIIIEGEAGGSLPAVLPVPVPAERRNVDTDLEHLAATMHVTLRRDGRTLASGTSTLAGLEIGWHPDKEPGVPRDAYPPSRRGSAMAPDPTMGASP